MSSYHSLSGLRVLNSLTRRAEALIPRRTNTLTWYTCGPTVYDSAHLGHGRTYVSVDMMQRVLRSYFRVPVVHAMGVTDIDDKIVARALSSGEPASRIATRFEGLFRRDMGRLGVVPPVSYLRVTEHLDAILEFIQTLVDHGLAYVVPSGVYFDTAAYGAYGGRLVPNNGTGEQQQSGGESEDDGVRDKRSVRDFALWKCSKGRSEGGNEVEWPSTWGAGRPGWHIECSAMTRSFFGDHLDVHAGGIDLKFPHHENEIAQSEAHLQCCHGSHSSSSNSGDWCSVFVHTGHLYIAGRKMSKSLKNFITLDEMLQTRSADEFRMLCALHRYESPLYYDQDSFLEASARVRALSAFLHDVSPPLSSSEVLNTRPHDAQRVKNVIECWGATQAAVHKSFCDNFFFRGALDAVQTLVSETRPLVSAPKCEAELTAAATIRDYVSSLLSESFGFSFASSSASSASSASSVSESANVEAKLSAAVDALVQFRHRLRSLAKSSSSPSAILAECDHIRDVILPSNLGVTVRDTNPPTWTWKP